MEKRYGLTKQGRSEEFREEDVWDMMNENVKNNFGLTRREEKPLISTSRQLPTAIKMIPGAQKGQELHGYGDEDDCHGNSKKMKQHSAPVNIPDWTKIYGKSWRRKNGTISASTSSAHDDDDGDNGVFDDENHERYDIHGYYHNDDYDYDDYYDYDYDDGESGIRLPPHEWLARKLASSRISSFSVCEGVGRTLKGRDLSRVRNAVWSKTGFM